MFFVITISAIVIFSAIFTNRFLNTLGIPSLLFFLSLGLFLGADGLLKIDYLDFEQVKDFSLIALAFVIFYGGFCTKWKYAKKVLAQAVALSTLGVFFTAVFVGIFCYIVFGLTLLESFLIGSVIGSTDAASVFSILKSKKLHLKEHTAPLLELESGSNDPMSYVLVVLVLTIMQGQSINFVFILFFKQMFFGILIGVLVSKIAIYIFQKTQIINDGNDSLFIIALVLTSYVLPQICDGNPFLAVYFLGIILGNAKIDNKVSMMNFFDSVNKLAQIEIFFMLGILASVNKLPSILSSGFIIFLYLTFIARPLAIFLILRFFNSSLGQNLLVSWAGLRGVASIVFAIIATDSGVELNYDLFHLVFLISIFSVAFQGTFLPWIAKKTDMIDENVDIKKTFNDYQEECAITYLRITVPTKHFWVGKKISEITFPENSLALLIKRGNKRILPKESTRVQAGDRITLTVPTEEL